MARTPKKRGARRPPEWEARFLAALSDTGNVLYSCRTAGIGRQTVYDARNRDEAFAELWDDALDEAADAMEIEARRRAVQGVKRTIYVRSGTDDDRRPVYEKQEIREYSDTLLIFLMKGARPEKYRDNYDLKSALAALAASSAGGVSGAEGDQGAKPAAGRRRGGRADPGGAGG